MYLTTIYICNCANAIKLELRVETDNFLMIFAENFPTRSSVLVKVGCINLNCSQQQQQLDNSFARENAMKI